MARIDKLTLTIVLERFADGPPKYLLIHRENFDPVTDAERLADHARSAILNTFKEIGNG